MKIREEIGEKRLKEKHTKSKSCFCKKVNEIGKTGINLRERMRRKKLM